MKVLRTSCNLAGHPEFRLTFDPAIIVVTEDAELLLCWLEKEIANGACFKVGQTCQAGWIVTQVRQHESGDLTLWEPDMRQLPVEFVEGVTKTLAMTRIQKDVVESLLDIKELSFPSMRQSAIICSRFGTTKGMVMERVKPHDQSDSGWFCGCRNDRNEHNHNDPGELKRVSLYEAAVLHSSGIIPYFALPPGILVGLENEIPIVFQNGELLRFQPGSYLATRYADI